MACEVPPQPPLNRLPLAVFNGLATTAANRRSLLFSMLNHYDAPSLVMVAPVSFNLDPAFCE